MPFIVLIKENNKYGGVIMAQVLEIGSGVKIEPFIVIEGGEEKKIILNIMGRCQKASVLKWNAFIQPRKFWRYIMCLKRELIMQLLSAKNAMP